VFLNNFWNILQQAFFIISSVIWKNCTRFSEVGKHIRTPSVTGICRERDERKCGVKSVLRKRSKSTAIL
jgi:hypothetical protein